MKFYTFSNRTFTGFAYADSDSFAEATLSRMCKWVFKNEFSPYDFVTTNGIIIKTIDPNLIDISWVNKTTPSCNLSNYPKNIVPVPIVNNDGVIGMTRIEDIESLELFLRAKQPQGTHFLIELNDRYKFISFSRDDIKKKLESLSNSIFVL